MSSDIFGIVTNPTKLRQAVGEHMLQHSELFKPGLASHVNFNDFIEKMKQPNEWVEDEVIFACAHFLNKNVYFMSKDNTKAHPLNKHYQLDLENTENFSQCLILGYLSQYHFQSLLLPSEICSIPQSAESSKQTKCVPSLATYKQNQSGPNKRRFTLQDYMISSSSKQMKKKKKQVSCPKLKQSNTLNI